MKLHTNTSLLESHSDGPDCHYFMIFIIIHFRMAKYAEMLKNLNVIVEIDLNIN